MTQARPMLVFHSLVPQPQDAGRTLDPIPFQPGIPLDNVREEEFHFPGLNMK